MLKFIQKEKLLQFLFANYSKLPDVLAYTICLNNRAIIIPSLLPFQAASPQ
jgi:hypothetical protein